jgi:predicted RNA methylase
MTRQQLQEKFQDARQQRRQNQFFKLGAGAIILAIIIAISALNDRPMALNNRPTSADQGAAERIMSSPSYNTPLEQLRKQR